MIYESYKPVIPAWVAKILAFEKQTGRMHHPDKCHGEARKKWDNWTRRYSRKLKYARMNGWIVDTESYKHLYEFVIYDAENHQHYYQHKTESEMTQKEISEMTLRILRVNPRATTCELVTKNKHITLTVTYEIDGDVSAEELARITNNVLQKERNDVGFDFTDEECFVEGIVVEMVGGKA